MPRSFPCRPVLAGLVVLAAGPALAQGTPRSVGECERLKNDLAYNQCLAMFGPAARNVAGGFAAADSAAPQAAIPQAEEPQAEPARGRRYRGRHGRQRAVFTSGRRR
ncbi:hypothetical protein [Methylobacterium hispanicum]|uniref:hypothetical protein n=1 Tax=Methylobacterium hispanicum TaxID=270350 RepID=UPI002F2F0319